VTKNLSVILEEAGYSAQDLMRATTDAGVRQALYNGILKETQHQVGDASRLTETFAGKQAAASAQTEIMKAKIGEALQPVLLDFLRTITPIIQAVATFAERHQTLTTVIILGTTALLGIVAALAAVGLAIATITPALPVLAAATVAATGTMSAAFAGVRTALLALQAAVAAPMIMGAIAVAGALADIALVMNAVNSVRQAISDLNAAKSSALNYSAAQTSTHDTLLKLKATGDAGQQARATDLLKQGYALGGFTGSGGINELAGVVHKGEYVIPQSGVDQRTGMPKAGALTGSTVSIDKFIVNNQIDVNAVIRKIGFKLATA
jgi:hypothetical protein